MKEQDYQAKILNDLRAKGHYNINVITASKNGVSDIISCGPAGRFYSIEVKRPGEKPSKLQYWNLGQVEKRRGVAFYADSFEMYLIKYDQLAVL